MHRLNQRDFTWKRMTVMVFFHSPVQICKHDGFTTQRGCRKHVKSKHSWYYYFDEKPDVQKESFDGEANNNTATDQKTARKMRTVATFDKTSNIAKNFMSWLTGSGGGCKSDRQAQQIVNRCLKFLKFCCEDEEELTFDIVDFSLCSPNLLFKFVDTMQDDWELGHTGRIGYLGRNCRIGRFQESEWCIRCCIEELVFYGNISEKGP